MNVIYYLIPVAILFVIVGVIAFFWATKTEQFDDLEKHGLSILMDDDELPTKQESKQETK
ncbi:cytochrome oxidase maturation protein Cbb3 [Psychrosphaera saromensis]|uniref:Cytochrome oxidase maturation protein, cbb3-type n=1 Tax=Psychrosphaera saromensis TaxID=716813 RepID=A0A2S7UXP6_9GAMM|nr:cbb3-type cytochrome oxidase assembly protein CcoS [Psychrosphaera saromensis]PQJ54262.1 cytochrome oxidase maturation protein, cbb3-type [Psychrosphaera saromensis]GHB74701.1 cytochrome oxidase maturation protein Cbb3 [Psychrosphaera saromensis]GLQ12637.1 cytochrome oxidase maturation protein Cbb3 [Psychrosphaera saromensis]